MTKRISRRAVLLFIALFLLMPGCSDRQDAQDEPDLPDPETNEPPLVEPQPSPGPEPAQPVEPTPAPKDKIGGENPVIAEGIWQINTSYFTQNNMTVDSIFVAGDDRVLFFVSSLNADGTVMESSSVYFFSLSTGRFLQQWIDIGIIGVYPDRVYDDGTVSVVTLDSESYEYREILFIDPQAMTASAIPAPADGDIVSLMLSPDKRYAALSTPQGLRVTGLDFSTTYLQIPSETTSAGEELLPSPTDWSADSRLLSFKMAAWESIRTPAVADIATGEIRALDALEGNEARFVGQQLFYSGWYPYLPCGFCTLDGLSPSETPLTPVGDPNDICHFSLSAGGTRLAVALQNPDGCDALVFDSHTGALLSSLPVRGQTFDEAWFTSDERTAVFGTASTLEQPKQIYVLDFGW